MVVFSFEKMPTKHYMLFFLFLFLHHNLKYKKRCEPPLYLVKLRYDQVTRTQQEKQKEHTPIRDAFASPPLRVLFFGRFQFWRFDSKYIYQIQ
ncbi:hypothetical protein D0T50_05695 [Bacteroides sp. 214]|nr:hypothetical protein [Bacteroides sp. 214]